MSSAVKSFCSRWTSLLLVLTLSLVLASCSLRQTEPDTIRIGVTVYDEQDTFIASLIQSLQQDAQQAEVRYGKLTFPLRTERETRPRKWSR